MYFTKLIILLAGILILNLTGCSSPEAEKRETEKVALADTHKLNPAFWDYAVSSNLLQMELGKLAVAQGTTEQVKKWGEQAITFHGKALQELKKASEGHHAIQLPDSLGGADKIMVEEFAALQGVDFDTRYKENLLISYKAQLSRYEEALLKTDSPQLREWFYEVQLYMQDKLQNVAQADSLRIIE